MIRRDSLACYSLFCYVKIHSIVSAAYSTSIELIDRLKIIDDDFLFLY
jgi:hypothetical protein